MNHLTPEFKVAVTIAFIIMIVLFGFGLTAITH